MLHTAYLQAAPSQLASSAQGAAAVLAQAVVSSKPYKT